jgi:hypothetical protein
VETYEPVIINALDKHMIECDAVKQN